MTRPSLDPESRLARVEHALVAWRTVARLALALGVAVLVVYAWLEVFGGWPNTRID